MNTTFDAKEAVKYMLDGFRIKSFEIEDIYYLDCDSYVISNYDEVDISYFISTNKNTLFQMADKNLAEWYRPKITWQENSPSNSPSEWQEDKEFYPTKKAFLDSYDKTGIYVLKVLEWETKYFPAMYEECE